MEFLKEIKPDAVISFPHGQMLMGQPEEYINWLSEDILAELEAAEREKSGIANLKMGYNRVHGYYMTPPNGASR